MRRWIGRLMMFALWAALFAFSAFLIGFLESVLVFGGSMALVVWIAVAVYLLGDDVI